MLRRRLILNLLICVASIATTIQRLMACPLQAPAPAEIQIGFDNQAKLGSWTPIFITLQADRQPHFFEATALDSDAVPVVTAGDVIRMADGQYQAWVRIGRTNGNIRVQLFDADKNPLQQFSLAPDDPSYPQFLASTQPLVLTIETGDVTLQAIQSQSSFSSRDELRVLAIHSARQLPATWIGYQGVNTIVLSTADIQLVNSINDQQLLAIRQWIENGGKLIFCAGQNSSEVLGDPGGIAQLLPGKFDGIRNMELSSRIEFYVKSNQQLIPRDGEPITVAGVIEPDGIIELQQSGIALVIRKPLGFGQIVFSAIDFDLEPVTDWPGQKNFLLKLLNQNENLNQASSNESPMGGRVSHPGYRDMTGQLRVPLERFSKVGFVTFTWVAVLIVAYILCIGPGDYFFLKKVTQRMELTWITFPLITLVFCCLAFAIARFTRPQQMQINQLEIIDLDPVAGIARGNMWTNIFSANSGNFDVSIGDQNALGLVTSNSCISWQGLPGDGLGGMQTKTTAGFTSQPYICQFQGQGTTGQASARLLQLPIQVSSTKSLFTQWWSDNPPPVRSRLFLSSNIGLLQGTFTNPLDVELKNCRLMFENWAYVMDQPLGPGQTVDVASNMRERTAVSYLTRRVREKDKGVNAPWNPLDTRMHRIADILMFYNVAGGLQYTGLSHGYQPYVDLSDQMQLQRAVLVGETDQLCTEITISGTARQPAYDNYWTLVRIVLPVQYRAATETK